MSRKFNYFAKAERDDMRGDIRFLEKNTDRNYDIDNTVTFHCQFAHKSLNLTMLNTTLINGTEVMEISGYVFLGGIWIPLG